MILGLIGRASNGKSTVAEAIKLRAEEQGLTACIYEISHHILRYCQKAGLIEKGKGRADCTPVDIQTLVEIGRSKRAENLGYWLDAIVNQIKIDKADVSIIPNCRATNEVGWVRSQRGVVIRVLSTNTDGSPYVSRDRDPNDPFETFALSAHPDFEIKTPRGAEELAKSYAKSLFDYLVSKEEE